MRIAKDTTALLVPSSSYFVGFIPKRANGVPTLYFSYSGATCDVDPGVKCYGRNRGFSYGQACQ